MCTQLWSVIPSRRLALTADTCHQALTWSSELTASSSASSRRLPRVGARTRTSASASLGAIGSCSLATGGLQQDPLADPPDPHPQWRAEALRRGLEDQQPRGQEPDPLDVDIEAARDHP